MDIKGKTELSSLIIESLDGNITPERLKRLDQLLSQDQDAVEYYVRHLRIYSAFVRRGQVYFDTNKPDIRNMELWDELAEYEKNAPTIEIETPESAEAPIEVLKFEKSPRVINKFSLFSAFISAAAAVLFVLIYVKFAPTVASSVATIEDSVNAQWSPSEYPTKVGERLWNNEGTRWLQKGMIKLAFDYGAEVIIEGPAEFKLESPEKMHLYSGRLYSTVPSGATGFIVQTPYSTVIDLGTEFGVKVDFDGTTDVHMFKGKASLIPGSVGEKKKGVELIAGQAKAVASNGHVQKIELETRSFVRKLDSKTGVLWRGESLNLADIVGGGNGLGTGTIGTGPALPDGHLPKKVTHTNFHTKPEYNSVLWSDFIDGIFVPDGEMTNVVSSLDHKFSGFHDTCGDAVLPVLNGMPFREQNLSDGILDAGVQLDSKVYGTQENPAIVMHPNAGITFDLDEIRKEFPGYAITAFRTRCGISETVIEHGTRKEPKADFWVLLDGQQVFATQRDMSIGEVKEIDISIDENQRFLTLVTTDGADQIESDWCLFAEPQLVLE